MLYEDVDAACEVWAQWKGMLSPAEFNQQISGQWEMYIYDGDIFTDWCNLEGAVWCTKVQGQQCLSQCDSSFFRLSKVSDILEEFLDVGRA